MFISPRTSLFSTLIVALLAGCNSSDFPPTMPVSGTVTMAGKPLERLSISFQLEGAAARTGFGVTNEKGEFQISTFDQNDGALLGTHTVTISDLPEKSAAAEKNTDPTALYGQPGGMFGKPVKKKSRIPEKYAHPKTSGLQATVTEAGPNQFTFELKD